MSGTQGNTAIHWVTDRILRGAIASARALPYAARVRAFGGLVEHVIGPAAGYRERARTHLSLIWPDMPPAERERIARAVCNNFGRTMIENYSRGDFARQIEASSLQGDGLAPLETARAERRPVLFVTGHFGNFEAPRVALTQRGYRIGGLYRPMSNPYFNAHYERTMMDLSGEVFPKGRKGTSGFYRMLKRGGMGTLLFDVRAWEFPKMDFLGHPAHTATSAADIALKLDALVIPYFAARRPDGLTFDMHVEAPITLTNAQKMMRDMTDRLEARIRVQPEQWFWIHKRWDGHPD